MESKTIDVNFDSLKHDFIRLTNQLRIISCTGEHIIKIKKIIIFLFLENI